MSPPPFDRPDTLLEPRHVNLAGGPAPGCPRKLPLPRDAGIHVLPCTLTALRHTLEADQHDTVLFEMYDVASQYLPVVRDHRPDAVLMVDSVDMHFARRAAALATRRSLLSVMAPEKKNQSIRPVVSIGRRIMFQSADT